MSKTKKLKSSVLFTLLNLIQRKIYQVLWETSIISNFFTQTLRQELWPLPHGKTMIREDRVIIYYLLRNFWKNRFGDRKQEVYFKSAKYTMFLQHWVVRAKKTPRGMSGLEIHTWKSPVRRCQEMQGETWPVSLCGVREGEEMGFKVWDLDQVD